MKTMHVIAFALPLCGALGCGDEVPAQKKPQLKPAVAQVAPAPQPMAAPTPTPVTPVAKPQPVAPAPAPMPTKGSELLAQARQLLAGGDNETALALARRAVKKLPESFLAWNTLGRAELEMNHGKEAQAAFEKAIEIKPDSSYAHNNLGLAYLYEERWEDALEELTQATSLAPQKPYMWNNLGIALEHLDRLDDARDAYEKAALGGAPNAQAALTRLRGVKSIKTAQAAPRTTTPAPQVEKVLDGTPVE
jgi:predicted Zn-dependent protease